MADFNLAEFDPDQFLIAVAGVPISQGAGQSGYADGEFLSVVQSGDSFGDTEGADGSVGRFKRNTRLVDIELTLLQTNSSNATLSLLHLADVNTPNGQGIGSFVAQDLQGTTSIICTRAWIKKPADVKIERGVNGRKWQIRALWSVFIVGGN